ncbi:MAG: metallophosphoesterase [Armatimonadota bacterium]|nr:metallophosphoesterase [Armatimonadota bacterium]
MIATAVILWLAVIVGLAFGYYVRYIEPARIEVTHTEVHLPDLPAALEGLTVGHLSDFHCQHDPAIEHSSREAIRLAMREHPDLIAIPGDMFENCEMARECGDQLRGLSAPLGVFAAPGNHDRAHQDPFRCLEAPAEDVRDLRAALRELGIELLANESRIVTVDGARIAVAGVDEYAFGRDDARRALEGTADADIILLLAHTPDMLDDPAVAEADLVLCGHTHGGQIQIPGMGAPWAPVWRDRRRASGLLEAGGVLAYVSRGVASATRARFCCRPEVAMLTLRRGVETNATQVPVRYAVRDREDVEEVPL